MATGNAIQSATPSAAGLSNPVTISQGGTGQTTDPLPPGLASDAGLLVENYDGAAASSTVIMVAGTLYLLRLNIRAAITITNICVVVTTAGNNTGGSTGTFAGLYNSAGTLLSGSADVAGSLTSGGIKQLALTTPQALAAATFVWAALLVNLGTTQPTLARTAVPRFEVMNGVSAAGSFRVAANGTLLTALPSPSITPGSNTATGAQAFWVAAT
jgi:hypothetical protein